MSLHRFTLRDVIVSASEQARLTTDGFLVPGRRGAELFPPLYAWRSALKRIHRGTRRMRVETKPQAWRAAPRRDAAFRAIAVSDDACPKLN